MQQYLQASVCQSKSNIRKLPNPVHPPDPIIAPTMTKICKARDTERRSERKHEGYRIRNQKSSFKSNVLGIVEAVEFQENDYRARIESISKLSTSRLLDLSGCIVRVCVEPINRATESLQGKDHIHHRDSLPILILNDRDRDPKNVFEALLQLSSYFIINTA